MDECVPNKEHLLAEKLIVIKRGYLIVRCMFKFSTYSQKEEGD